MTRSRIEQLLARHGPRIRNKFRAVMQRVKDAHTLAKLEAALEAGRVAEVLDDVTEDVERAAKATAQSIEAVQLATSHEVADKVAQASGKIVSYDTTNPRAVDALRRQALRRVGGLTQQSREVVTAILVDGINRGINPRQQAKAIRETIGLSPSQAKAVQAYRASLEAPTPLVSDDPEAPAPKPAKARTQTEIDKLVERKADRALKQRAETIARTEAKAAVHEGMEDGYQQAVDSGVLEADRLECKWHSTSANSRAWHRSMNQQTRPWGVPFTSGHGVSLIRPGDANAPADERANCQCGWSVRVLRRGVAPESRDQHGPIAKAAQMLTMITGWSGTGKSCVYGKAIADEHGVPLLATDAFIPLGWSEASAHVAEMLTDGVSRVVEGVAVPRVLRKMLAAAPTIRPCARLVIVTKALRPQTAGQVKQGRQHDAFLAEILPALIALGVEVVRDPPWPASIPFEP